MHIDHLILPYQLGSVEDHERAEVERHLLDCEACLGAYLTVKRRLDLASASEERPSVDLRFRVRAAVARKLPERRPTSVRWVLFGAAAAGALALFALNARHPATPNPPSNPQPTQLIDKGAEVDPSVN